MAKGFALASTLTVSTLVALLSLSACSQKDSNRTPGSQNITPEPLPISNSKLTNCHFKDAHPVYSFQSTIAPNPISCDNGVPRKVELLTPTPLPGGLQFAMNQLSLTGSPSEKVTSAPYQFYLENEAGYVIIPIQITVK